MSGYGVFAKYYDSLTENIDYRKRAAYFVRLIEAHGAQTSGKLMLDLGCGTGSLTLELFRLGIDMIGADASPDMLSIAASKEGAQKLLWICQPMQGLRLHGPVDFIISALDTINHVTDLSVLERAFGRVSKYLKPGGLFIFDVNSEYKHKHVLADNVFVYENNQIYCVWQNFYDEPKKQTLICLDFFERQNNGEYLRFSESFCERVYTHSELESALGKAGLSLEAVYEGDTLEPVRGTAQRLVYVIRKPPV